MDEKTKENAEKRLRESAGEERGSGKDGGKLTPAEAERIQSNDLPSGDPAPSGPLKAS